MIHNCLTAVFKLLPSNGRQNPTFVQGGEITITFF